MSGKARALLSGMLQKSPKHRYGIWSVIEDPWMKVNEEEDISSLSECSKIEDSLEVHKTETSRITGALCSRRPSSSSIIS